MKRALLHSLWAAALTVGSWLTALPATAAVITLAPSSLSATAGGPLTLDVRVSDLGPGVSLGGFDLDLGYNSLLLSFTGAVFGSALGNPASFEALTSASVTSPGVLDLSAVSLLTPAQLAAAQTSPSFSLATLSFNALGSGTVGFTLLPSSVLSDALGNPLAISNLTPIPEPETLLLFSLGLAALTVVRRRRGSRA